MYCSHVLVCGGTGCISSRSPKIMEAPQNGAKKQGLEEEVTAAETGCHGLCVLSPVMIVYPDATFYSMVQPKNIPEIVAEHLLKSRVVTYLLYQETINPNGGIKALGDTDFYEKQHRIALRNCGVIDPENIGRYIGTGGYQAPGKVLTEMTPDGVAQTLLDTGPRGRGGAGFPTGLKWKLCRQNDVDQKYVYCNADEGGPGAPIDHSVPEGGPRALFEIMTTASYAIKSNQDCVYVRTEYPIAVERLKIAINQAREMELLGKNIFGTGFDFDVDIHPGVGIFVCDKETVLMTSIEGKRGEPRPRLPFPAQKGLFGKPSILNNVEAYADIFRIIPNGPEWFTSMGAEKSKGIKASALGGRINSTDLAEVPMGITLRAIVGETGGSIPNGKKFRAAQTNGPSGGRIPAEHSDTPIDYGNLLSVDSMMGSDGLIVMDEDDYMVDIAKFFLGFTVEESYGKCVVCCIGARRILEILGRITKGIAEMADLDKLGELCHYVKINSLYGLGQTAPNPVLSALYFFRDEYEAYIEEKRYPAGVCKTFLSYVIDRDKCRGCTLRAYTCPTGAIVGSIKNPHVIDLNKCIKCGARMEKCKFGAICKK